MAYLRLHADDGENGRQRICQSTSANCKSAQNQHEEAVCQCIQPNRENGSRVNAPCRGEVDDVPLGCSIERKYDDETTAGACRGLDGDDGRN